LILVGTAFALTGCGDKPTGSISGTVKHKGQPVTSGTINLILPDKGLGYDGKIGSSGTFSIDKVETGKYKVYISPPQVEQLPPGKAPSKAEPFAVPKKYQDQKDTTLSVDVKAGKNDGVTIDIPD